MEEIKKCAICNEIITEKNFGYEEFDFNNKIGKEMSLKILYYCDECWNLRREF